MDRVMSWKKAGRGKAGEKTSSSYLLAHGTFRQASRCIVCKARLVVGSGSHSSAVKWVMLRCMNLETKPISVAS